METLSIVSPKIRKKETSTTMGCSSLKETETKIVLKNCREIEEITKLLGEKGFKFMEEVYEEDHYFNHPCRDLRETDEALRIRISDKKHQTTPSRRYTLTYKGPKKMTGKAKSREEVVVEIDNPEDLRYLLEKLGFNKVGIVRKTRKYYRREAVTVSLDIVDKLGCFVEIEVEQGVSKVSEMINRIIKELDLNNYTFTHKSYLELLLEKRVKI